MATTTSTLFAAQGSRNLKAPHTGIVTLNVFHNTLAVTASAGDVLFLAKIPHGARITEVRERHSTGATAHGVDIGLATGWNVGGGASLSCIIAAGAQATQNFMNVDGNIPPVVSVSDASPDRFGILAAVLASAGTGTISLKIAVSVSYTMDANQS